MKSAFTYLTLTIFILACGGNHTKDVKSNNNTSENTQQVALRGTWTIKKYYFSNISAMDEKMANEWLNQSIVIDDKLHFDYEKIISYKDVFNKEDECSILNMDKPEVLTADEYFDTIRDPLDKLKINQQTVKVYKTTCKHSPFSELVLNERNEIIFQWDGAFFVLTKE